MAPLLLFTPLPSRPSPSFFSSLTALKLDTLKLDDSSRAITGTLEEGKSVVDREAVRSTAVGDSGQDGNGMKGEVWIGGCLTVDGSSLEVDRSGTGSYPLTTSSITLSGTFRNFNTIEDFRNANTKKAMFDVVVRDMLRSWTTAQPIFNPFLLLSYADLKKYKYTYQFASPVMVQKPAWEIGEEMRVWEGDATALRRAKSDSGIDGEAFLLKQGAPASEHSHEYVIGRVHDWTEFFVDVPAEERILVFHDPSSFITSPGWTLRNILLYLSVVHKATNLRVISLRSGSPSATKTFSTSIPDLPEVIDVEGEAPLHAVGWEKNAKGSIVPKLADLGATMDPHRLADQAVDLNLKLMRWRVMPNLDLDKIAGTRCLLLGAGTLGCYVARCLMGWGVRNITFVDSAKVSYSNPVRQPLFEFEDCVNGGKPKAQCAADSLKRIFPGVNAVGHDLMIPMPGHPVAPVSEDSVAADVKQLESLMADHDAVFLLMDSRESRWLPTVIGTSMSKIVINAALGFDSWLVMRHGVPQVAAEGAVAPLANKKLGCYYCNDVVAPRDSLTDRSLDQMCTVTRPGIAPIAAATAVEVLVSLLQHPAGVHAPADLASPTEGSSKEPESVLGLVPHQLRGYIAQFRTMLIEGASYDRCTGCSAIVTDAYRSEGFKMLLSAFNNGDYLEQLTGLDKVHEEGEAMMEAVDWEDGSSASGSM